LLCALRRDGAVLVQLPAHERLPEVVAACYQACGEFFARPFGAKTPHYAGSGIGQAHGYMDYLSDAEGSECFEVKLHYDKRFEWPTTAGLRDSVNAALDVQRRTGVAILDALAQALQLDAARVDGLLDARRKSHSSPTSPSSPSSPSSVDLSTASHTAMRVWQYTHGRPSGWHCDNTLLTLAPRGSAAGLQAKSPVDGRTFFPERHMDAHSVLVFAGDALSFLTAGHVPALMHRVLPPADARRPRLSCPFFLRARRGALLHSERQGTLSHGAGRSLPALLVTDLEHNAGNLRASWPWKRTPYYEGSEWHPIGEECTPGQ